MPEQARTVASAGRGAYRAMALAPSTRRLYGWLWAAWERHCALEHLIAFPATPDEVAVYLERRADAGDRLSTLLIRAAAIGARHRDEGLPSPCRNHEFQLLFKGIARAQAGETPAQASGLTSAVIERIEAALNMSNPKHQATVALCRVMRDGMLRRGEATELRWDDITEGSDGAGELLIRHSKTDQTGHGHVFFLSAATMTALARIRPADATGRIFPVHPLTIARRITAAAAQGETAGPVPRTQPAGGHDPGPRRRGGVGGRAPAGRALEATTDASPLRPIPGSGARGRGEVLPEPGEGRVSVTTRTQIICRKCKSVWDHFIYLQCPMCGCHRAPVAGTVRRIRPGDRLRIKPRGEHAKDAVEAGLFESEFGSEDDD